MSARRARRSTTSTRWPAPDRARAARAGRLADADGRCDVTPRGGPPGFVGVLDDHHLAIPDATGNRRLDTLRNVVANGHAGLIFLIPGRGQTLRVNGARGSPPTPALLDRLTPVGKPPRTAIVVRAEEVYAHCPKAFVRSGAGDPETWLERGRPAVAGRGLPRPHARPRADRRGRRARAGGEPADAVGLAVRPRRPTAPAYAMLR